MEVYHGIDPNLLPDTPIILGRSFIVFPHDEGKLAKFHRLR